MWVAEGSFAGLTGVVSENGMRIGVGRANDLLQPIDLMFTLGVGKLVS